MSYFSKINFTWDIPYRIISYQKDSGIIYFQFSGEIDLHVMLGGCYYFFMNIVFVIGIVVIIILYFLSLSFHNCFENSFLYFYIIIVRVDYSSVLFIYHFSNYSRIYILFCSCTNPCICFILSSFHSFIYSLMLFTPIFTHTFTVIHIVRILAKFKTIKTRI